MARADWCDSGGAVSNLIWGFRYYNETTRMLYFAYNGTGPPPSTARLGVVTLQNLLQIKGEGAGPTALPGRPAKDITVRGKPLIWI